MKKGSHQAKTNYKPLKLHKSFLTNPKYYKGFTLGLFAFLCAYAAASTFAPVQSSDASTVTITNNTSDYFIQITSADALNLNVTASPTGQMAIAKDTINIVTNSPNGYKLYVSTSGNDNNIYQGGDSSTSSQGYFQPTTGNISTPISLSQNAWGFALDKTSGSAESANFASIDKYSTGNPSPDSTWAKVPTFTNSSDAKISEASGYNSPDGTDLDIFYGINASTALPTGNYNTEVTYTAFSEGVNVFPTMQDFTAARCDAMGANTSINLSDSRDDKYYRVTKMADGHCWMTDNLALDGTDKAGNVRVLTPSDSNVTSNVTLAENISADAAASDTVVQINSNVANNTTDACDTGMYPYCIVNTTTKYGNLYNWYAATAKSGTTGITGGDASQDICPKGWKMPSNTGDFSYPNLIGKYNMTTTGEINGAYVQTAQSSPLFFALAGQASGSTLTSQGNYGNYWSKSARNSGTSYYLSVRSSTGQLLPANSSDKYNSFSVRCVFGGQSDEIMQNFTATMCADLAESTATVDNRKTMIDSRDGKFYTISKLADGNCWMTSNLALDGMDGLGAVRTLTPTDSNVTQDRLLATNITNGTTSQYDVAQIYSGNANSVTSTCNASYPDCVVNTTNKYGNLYNWNAATATVGLQATTTTVTESVCPKGWQLPDNTGTESFNALMSAYNLPTVNGMDHAAAQTIQKTPLNFPLAGLYADSSVNQTRIAIYWSRTVVSSNTINAYHLYFDSENGAFNPQRSDRKYSGFSVRCIFGS